MSTTAEQSEYRVVTHRTGPEHSPCWTGEVHCRRATGGIWYVLKGVGTHMSPRDAEATAERWLADYLALGWIEATRRMDAHALRLDGWATAGEVRDTLRRIGLFIEAIEDPQVLMYLRDLIHKRLDGVQPGGDSPSPLPAGRES